MRTGPTELVKHMQNFLGKVGKWCCDQHVQFFATVLLFAGMSQFGSGSVCQREKYVATSTGIESCQWQSMQSTIESSEVVEEEWRVVIVYLYEQSLRRFQRDCG